MIWIILFLIAIIFFVGTAVIEAWYDIKTRPTEPMEWCPKGHGYFRRKHALEFMGVTVCPLCYKEALDKASKI